MAEKQKKILLCAIVLLYAVLFFIFIISYAFDDLGFDFAGYALRYKFAFSGWIKNLLFGIPAGTFDGELPSLLPLVFQSLGFGSFTLPVTLSVFALQLLVPVVFLFIGKLFGIEWKKSVLLGLLFVLNPFTFKFLNRYYEFAAWFLFFVSFYFYYKFLESKAFDKKNFAFAVFASSAMVLSHPSLILFWGIAFAALLLDFVDLKRFAATAFFTTGLAAFWLLPFFGFSSLSIVSAQKGSELMTTGIRASNYFFALAMPLILLVFHRNIKRNARIFRFFSIATIIAVAYAIAPATALPLLNIPFAHSFHVFFFFAIIIAAMQLAKSNAINRKHVAFAGIAALVCVVLFFPIVARQYAFQEPRYSNYEFEGQRINHSEFEALLQKISKNARFETLPSDTVIYAQANAKQSLLSLRGWGYNAYALKESNEIGVRLTSMNISCLEFVAGSEKTATAYWIALNEIGENFLNNCGLKKIGGKLPSLHLLDSNKTGLVDGAELLQFENTFIKFRADQNSVLVKTSWFPRWHAFSGGKELAIENAKPGMIVVAEPGSIVELRYEKTGIDFAGIIISLIVLFLFVLALL